MPKSTVLLSPADRKRAFRIALIQRDMSAADFAAIQGVSRQAIHKVLSGQPSERLTLAIDRFIAATEKRVRRAA